MRNKERYDLTQLSIVPKYRVNGCGKKIEDQCWIDITYMDNIVVKEKETREAPIRFLLNWLEEES